MSPDAKNFAKGCQFEESSLKVDLALVVAWFSPVNLLVCASVLWSNLATPFVRQHQYLTRMITFRHAWPLCKRKTHCWDIIDQVATTTWARCIIKSNLTISSNVVDPWKVFSVPLSNNFILMPGPTERERERKRERGRERGKERETERNQGERDQLLNFVQLPHRRREEEGKNDTCWHNK